MFVYLNRDDIPNRGSFTNSLTQWHEWAKHTGLFSHSSPRVVSFECETTQKDRDDTVILLRNQPTKPREPRLNLRFVVSTYTGSDECPVPARYSTGRHHRRLHWEPLPDWTARMNADSTCLLLTGPHQSCLQLPCHIVPTFEEYIHHEQPNQMVRMMTSSVHAWEHLSYAYDPPLTLHVIQTRPNHPPVSQTWFWKLISNTTTRVIVSVYFGTQMNCVSYLRPDEGWYLSWNRADVPHPFPPSGTMDVQGFTSFDESQPFITGEMEWNEPTHTITWRLQLVNAAEYTLHMTTTLTTLCHSFLLPTANDCNVHITDHEW